MNVKYYLNNPRKIIYRLMQLCPYPWPDKFYVKFLYKDKFGKRLNLDTPKSFNEKLQWLKFNAIRNDFGFLVDKYEVKSIVSEVVGEDHVIPTLGVWSSFDEIDFNLLPSQFVLKCTHDSGSVVICRDKSTFDKSSAKKRIDSYIKRNYFYAGREYPYRNIKHRVLAEPFLIDEKSSELRDYKFFCFNGEVKFFKVDWGRFVEHHANYYDLNMNLLPFYEKSYPRDDSFVFEKPYTFDDMIRYARMLSDGIPFVRIDFYEVNNKLYFGEITFYPESGFGIIVPEEWNQKLGDMLVLPKL